MAELSKVVIDWDEQDRPVVTVTYGSGDGSAAAGDPDEWLAALAGRLTDKSATNLRALIEVNESRGSVSLADLASHLGIEKREVDGWNRNLGRSVKAVVREYGFLRPDYEDGTAQILDYEWDKANEIWLYAVPSQFRPALVQALDER